MSATAARDMLETMRQRLAPMGSSERLRRDVRQAIRLIDDRRYDEAIELVDHLAANVADSERLRAMGRDPEREEDLPYWADESDTGAYSTLSRVRHEWGFLGMRRRGSNVTVFRSSGD